MTGVASTVSFLLATLALVVASALPATPAKAEMYSDEALSADRSRLAARIVELHRRLTLPQHLPTDGGWLAEVPLVPQELGPRGHPLGFASDGHRVFVPLVGLKFIEDLTMAYAWRYRTDRSLEPFDVYLAMLRYRPERDWPDGRYMDPLEAFGVPELIWERDRAVGELGTALRNEAWAFILGHELGHLYHRHPGNLRVAPAESQANEREADAFAFAIFDRTHEIPLGAVLYFQATVAFFANRADAASDEAFARWQRDTATHPVNAQRLLDMAQRMRASAREETDPGRREALQFIAVRLTLFADGLDDPAMQQAIVKLALENDPRRLRDR